MVEEKTELLHEGIQFMKEYAAAEKRIVDLKDLMVEHDGNVPLHFFGLF